MSKSGVLLFFGLVAIGVAQKLVGAPEAAAKDDQDVIRMANFAVGEIGSEYELVRIVSATNQIVNGILYKIELVTRRAIKGQKNKRRRCNVRVYEIRHQGYLELEEFHCQFA